MGRQISLFKEIYKEKDRKCCEVCGKLVLGFNPANFAHIIPKGTYPKFKFRKKNIAFLCFECHQKYDHYTDKAKGDPAFDNLFQKHTRLKAQYENLRRNNIFFLKGLC